jgi:hypothetical protein
MLYTAVMMTLAVTAEVPYLVVSVVVIALIAVPTDVVPYIANASIAALCISIISWPPSWALLPLENVV